VAFSNAGEMFRVHGVLLLVSSLTHQQNNVVVLMFLPVVRCKGSPFGIGRPSLNPTAAILLATTVDHCSRDLS
jgi:hypothetical protein